MDCGISSLGRPCPCLGAGPLGSSTPRACGLGRPTLGTSQRRLRVCRGPLAVDASGIRTNRMRTGRALKAACPFFLPVYVRNRRPLFRGPVEPLQPPSKGARGTSRAWRRPAAILATTMVWSKTILIACPTCCLPAGSAHRDRKALRLQFEVSGHAATGAGTPRDNWIQRQRPLAHPRKSFSIGTLMRSAGKRYTTSKAAS